MARYKCSVCGYVYDEQKEGQPWRELAEDWACPACGSAKSLFGEETLAADAEPAASAAQGDSLDDYLAQWKRESDDVEPHFADIQAMSLTGESVVEPMRTKKKSCSWEDILIKGAQLARIPLGEEEPVRTETVIGPKAQRPLVIDTPIYVSHMSFGALSKAVKLALSKGSAAVRTAMCSGEGGILEQSLQNAHKYIFEYVPNKYSVTDENLRRVDAIEIKIGQSAKPGLGGHLPAAKVTEEIAAVRGVPTGADVISPSHFEDIRTKDDLKRKIDWLREKSGGRPIGVKIAAGHVEADLEVALYAAADFVTFDGRAGATGAAPKFVKDATSVPTLFALCRARKFLDERTGNDVSLVVTGGLRISADFAKALALGADAVAIATAALMACGCQQYRICHTGKCPVGITSQDPQLTARLKTDQSARRLENFLRASTEELKTFARLTGKSDVHDLDITDTCTMNSEISGHTEIEHV